MQKVLKCGWKYTLKISFNLIHKQKSWHFGVGLLVILDKSSVYWWGTSFDLRDMKPSGFYSYGIGLLPPPFRAKSILIDPPYYTACHAVSLSSFTISSSKQYSIVHGLYCFPGAASYLFYMPCCWVFSRLKAASVLHRLTVIGQKGLLLTTS